MDSIIISAGMTTSQSSAPKPLTWCLAGCGTELATPKVYIFPVRARDRITETTTGRPLSKGDWTRLQQDSISENSLAGRGFRFGLDAYILKNAGTVNISTQMMATALKAIVGAVFEDSDSDLKAVHAAMDNLGFFGHELLAHTDCAFFADSAESPNDV